MSSRVRDHIRSNIYGILALFLVLTGGTAIANHPGGANTISSGDIIDGEVKEADVGQAAVASAEVKNDSLVAGDIAPDSLTSGKIANGSLTGIDIGGDSLTGADVQEDTLAKAVLQRRIGAGCPSGQAIRSVGDSGGVTCQALTGSSPLGPAGGDLAGNYPNPQIAANAVGGAEVADGSLGGSDVANGSLIGADIVDNGLSGVDVLDNSLTGADVNESTLDSGSFVTGRSAIQVVCGIDSVGGGSGVNCAEVTLNLSRTARMLVITTGNWYVDAFDAGYSGTDSPDLAVGNCRLIVDGATQAAQNVGERKTNSAASEVAWTDAQNANGTLSMTAVTDVLAPGSHTAALHCTEEDGNIEYQNINTAAVVLGNG